MLFMLIHYSISAFELLERKLSVEEKNEIVLTFSRIGERMHLSVPANYAAWLQQYHEHLEKHLIYSEYTRRLFIQYRKHLGMFRYFIVLEVQRLLVPIQVKKLLSLGSPIIIKPFLALYRLIRKSGAGRYILFLLVPDKFHQQLKVMNNQQDNSNNVV